MTQDDHVPAPPQPEPQSTPVVAGDAAAGADLAARPTETAEADAEGAAAPAAEYQPVETRSEVEVGLVRSVRFGPILIGAALLGAVIAAISALFFPVAEDATYEMGQVAGFSSLIGATIGLFLGGVLSLILARSAKRQSGAARAVLTDVR